MSPAAYYWGGAIARGYADCIFANKEAIDLALIDRATTTGTAFTSNLDRDASTLPLGARIAVDTSWMIELEGELQLAAGTNALEFQADDFGALEIAGERVVTTEFAQPGTGMFTAPADGWYPFRAVVCQTNGGGAGFDFELATLDLTRSQLRARVEELRGVVASGFPRRQFGGLPAYSLWTEPLISSPFDNLAQLPLGASTDQASARFSGQLLATEGDHPVHVDTDDGHRVAIGETMFDLLFSGGSNITSDGTVALAEGWQRLTFDWNNDGGGANAIMHVDTVPIPVAQLRPAPSSRGRSLTVSFGQDDVIPNSPNTLVRTWDARTLPGELVEEVWLSYAFTHGMPREITASLQHGTVTHTFRTNSDAGSPTPYRITAFDGMPVEGLWAMSSTDTGGAQVGSLTDYSLTVNTRGGPPNIAQRAGWTSPTRKVGAAMVDTIRFEGAFPMTTSALVFVRTCAADPCANEPWTGPYASGDPVTAPGNEYAQVRVELVANGEVAGRVDLVELQYRVRP